MSRDPPAGEIGNAPEPERDSEVLAPRTSVPSGTTGVCRVLGHRSGKSPPARRTLAGSIAPSAPRYNHCVSLTRKRLCSSQRSQAGGDAWTRDRARLALLDRCRSAGARSKSAPSLKLSDSTRAAATKLARRAGVHEPAGRELGRLLFSLRRRGTGPRSVPGQAGLHADRRRPWRLRHRRRARCLYRPTSPRSSARACCRSRPDRRRRRRARPAQ